MNKRGKKKAVEPIRHPTLAQFFMACAHQSAFGRPEVLDVMRKETSSNLYSVRYDKDGRIMMILFDTEPRDPDAKLRPHGK